MVVRFIDLSKVLNPKKIPASIGMMAHLADTLGYMYFLWDGIVYQKEMGIWMRTPFTSVNFNVSSN